MAIKPVLRMGHPVLLQKALSVEAFDIIKYNIEGFKSIINGSM